MIFGIKNKKTLLLILIIVISTALATIIQFVKGYLFEQALVMNAATLIPTVAILGFLILTEVVFYYFEWSYENILIRDAFAMHKSEIINNTLDINEFKGYEKKIDHRMNLLTNVVDRLEFTYYMSYFNVIYLTMRVVFVTIAFMYINIFVGILMFGLMFVPLLLTKLFQEKIAKLENYYQEQKGKNLSFYKNLFSNLKYIRISNKRDAFYEKALNRVNSEKEIGKSSEQNKLQLNTFYSFYSYGLHFIILAVSIMLIAQGKISSGMIITLLGLTEQLSMPILSLSTNINNINSTKQLREDISAAKKQSQIRETPIKFNKAISTKQLEIELNDFNLIYNNIGFQAKNKYLIEGTSGVGKSVFLELITGLITPSNGKIFYDNTEFNNTYNSFEDIEYIMTDVNLFEGNGIFNILLKEDYTESQMEYMQRFIDKDKLLNSDVTSLSSGEKRRILLLRGLMSTKSTIIFDEPTANLDDQNAVKFWEEILILDKTVIVVSHDIPQQYKDKFDTLYNFNDYVFKKKH